MAFLRWVEGHIAGWQMLLPGAIVLGLAAVYASRHKRNVLVPWLAFGTWLATSVAAYVASHAHHLFGYQRRHWTAIVVTTALATSIPVGAALLATYAPPLRQWPWQRQAIAAIAFAISVIPLTNVVSHWMFLLLWPWFGRP